MRKALCLAERGRGRTSPNPMVGAVIVDDEGVVIGRGSHEAAGGPHAEVHALRDAGARARGATLYSTLEPCSHSGRTGPCAPLVAGAGIRRAVIATRDPNPVASGGGEHLRRQGIAVTFGVLAPEAQRLNEPFFSLVTRGRPYVTMKVALSLDGCIGGAGGMPIALTGGPAHRVVHRERAETDALAVGSGTVVSDDPSLTPRVAYRARPLTRIVFDGRLRTPPGARLFTTLDAGPVIIVTAEQSVDHGSRAAAALVDAGATLLPIDPPRSLEAALRAIAARGISSLIVEGGAELHRAFWDGGWVDRVQIFVAARVVGPGGTGWVQAPVMSSGLVTDCTARPVGEDVLLEGYVHRTH